MPNPIHDAPEDGKPASDHNPECPRSDASTLVSAAVNGACTPSSQPTCEHWSQDFMPVRMTPPSINQFTNPLFARSPFDANGLLSTSHLYAHPAPAWSQQEPARSSLVSTDTEELLSRALSEVRQQLYERQLDHDIDQSPQPALVQNQLDENDGFQHLVSYLNPVSQHPDPAQVANLPFQHAFSRERQELKPAMTTNSQSPTLSDPSQDTFNQYWRQQETPAQYRQHHHSPSQIQHARSDRQPEEAPSRKRLRSDSKEQSSSEVYPLHVEKPGGDKPSQKRSRCDLKSVSISQPEQGEEEPSQKRPRGGSQSQVESQLKEQPRRVSNGLAYELDTSVHQLGVNAEPVKQITVSATQFNNRAKAIIKSNAQTKYKDWAERTIARDIASTLMLSGIYLDSMSSVNESAAWVEWAFSIQGIWKIRPIASIPHAVPEHLLEMFNEMYGNGKNVPRFDKNDELVHDTGGKKEQDAAVE
ncbi:hypothetical protein FKW77_004391 [Venturia effusa]|uniref:Uncharacterized protein n=1 Tax=Venturia effusa TaxID=50376 RepID=A0A517LMS3_9PEZI|nr:hypothetical protein FKW77_004391 [Venturia effusa]